MQSSIRRSRTESDFQDVLCVVEVKAGKSVSRSMDEESLISILTQIALRIASDEKLSDAQRGESD